MYIIIFLVLSVWLGYGVYMDIKHSLLAKLSRIYGVKSNKNITTFKSCTAYLWSRDRNKKEFQNLLYYSICEKGLYMFNPFYKIFLGVLFIPYSDIIEIKNKKILFFNRNVLILKDGIHVALSSDVVLPTPIKSELGLDTIKPS